MSQSPASNACWEMSSDSQASRIGSSASCARASRATSSASGRPADVVQGVAEVHRGRGDVERAVRPLRHVQRAAQRLRALLDPARRHERDAERVERADLVHVAPARLLEPRLLAERLAGHPHRRVVARLDHERPGAPREEPGALRARAVRLEQREPAVEHPGRLLLAQHAPEGAVKEAVEPGRAARLLVLVDERERALEQRHRAGVVVGVEVADGGALEQRGLAHAGEALGLRHPVPQLQRALEQRGALAVRPATSIADCPARTAARQRRRLVARGVVVVGDGGGPLVVERPVLRLERPRQRQVQLGALARQEVVVDGLAQQRVAQHVALALGHDDVARDRLAQCRRAARAAPSR